jgi:hypothetical protein
VSGAFSEELGRAALTLAAIGGALGIGYVLGWGAARERALIAPAASSPLASVVSSQLSPSASSPVIPLGADYEERHAAAGARKNDAIDRCEKEGGASALGFGYSVICLKKNAVSWQFDPNFPPLSEGLK